jgi:uncharacterized membrane protein YfhO/putative flippase GtrA
MKRIIIYMEIQMRNKLLNFASLFIKNLLNDNSKFYSFLRFGFVGVTNTIVFYMFYLIFLKLNIFYLTSYTIAFIISMIGSYFMNCFFTFKTKPTLMKFIKFPLTVLANYIISSILIVILVSGFNIDKAIAAIFAAILPIPITYFVTRRVLKKSEQEKKERIDKKKLVLNIAYGLIFLAIILFFSLLYHGYFLFTKSLFVLQGRDDISQFLYFVPFLQKAFLSGQPFWSWSNGLGGGVFGEFSYYYTTSPFFYLMLLIRYIGIGTWDFVNVLQWKLVFSILKQFLSMAFMFSLLRYEGKKRYTSLIGAVVFGGCILFIRYTVAFDFMVEAYAWVPLTILGYLIYKKTQKPWVLLVGLVVTVVNSFYFGYMSFIFYAVFIIVFVEIKGKTFFERVCSIFNYFKTYIVFVLISMGIAAVFFIPSIFAFLNSDRFSTVFIIPKMFPASFFLQLPEKLFFNAHNFGFPFVLLIVFFLPWKQLSAVTKRKIVLVGICFLFYIIPYSYSVFNGFSYMNDRWVYIFVFAVAFALPDLLESNDKNKNIGFGFLCFSYIFFAFCYYTETARGLAKVGHLYFIVLALGAISLLALVLKKYVSKNKTIFILNIVFSVTVLFALLVNSLSYAILFTPATEAQLKSSGIQNAEETAMYSKLIPKSNDFFRVINRDSDMENAPLNYGYYGASVYNSLVNANIYKWMKREFDVLDAYVSTSRFDNFDDRLFLEAAFGVKYITTSKSDTFKPYGFTLKSQTADFNVYENQHPLGIDSWYESAVSTSTFNSWSIAQRDAMLLQTVVLPDNLSQNYSSPSATNVTTPLTVDWNHLKLNNAEYKNGVLYAKSNASFELPIENVCKNQAGEVIVQLNLKPQNGIKLKINVNGKETMKVEEDYNWTYPIYDYTFRLEGNTEILKCTLTPGNYNISNFNVWFNSYEQYTNLINSLNKYNLQNLYVSGGKVKGTFENKTKGILVLNIPYCEGWKSTVDGKSQKIIKANGAFSGLLLDPGKHVIELDYETPGLMIGAIISVISFSLLVAVYLYKKKRHKK